MYTHCQNINAQIKIIVIRIRWNTLPFIVSTCDSRRASRTRVTTDIVIDGLPKTASADGIITTKHLHFCIEQEQIDYGGKKIVKMVKIVNTGQFWSRFCEKETLLCLSSLQSDSQIAAGIARIEIGKIREIGLPFRWQDRSSDRKSEEK